MSTTVTFTRGSSSYTLYAPMYGYRSACQMDIQRTETGTGRVETWDSGTEYRMFEGDFLVDATTRSAVLALRNMVRDTAHTLTLSLGVTASGFFPFGPDLGDTGDFVVKIIGIDDTGIKYSPWLTSAMSLRMLMVSAPEYEMEDDFDEGDFFIGSLTGMAQPQESFTVSHERKYVSVVTKGGSHSPIDSGAGNDAKAAQFTVKARKPKAQALMDYLCIAMRGNSVAIDNTANLYPFGVTVASGGGSVISVRNNRSMIECVHEDFNLWSFPLDFAYDGVS